MRGLERERETEKERWRKRDRQREGERERWRKKSREGKNSVSKERGLKSCCRAYTSISNAVEWLTTAVVVHYRRK